MKLSSFISDIFILEKKLIVLQRFSIQDELDE